MRHFAVALSLRPKRPEANNEYKVVRYLFQGILGYSHLDPTLLADGAAAASLSEAALEKIMEHPKFWRDQDPKTVKLVRDGFKHLYPG